MRNRVQETGRETEDNRVEPVGDLVVTNVGTDDDRVEPVREANEEIVKELEAVLDVVAHEGAQSSQLPPILDIEVSIEGTENFRVPPKRRYVPGPRSSKRLRSQVSGDSPPKRTRTGAQGAEDQSAVKKHQDQEVDRYFAKLRPDIFRVKERRNPNKVPAKVNSVQARLSIQRKSDAAVIDKAKSINRNWREVKIWGKSVTGI
jgi:hypothetical protein